MFYLIILFILPITFVKASEEDLLTTNVYAISYLKEKGLEDSSDISNLTYEEIDDLEYLKDLYLKDFNVKELVSNFEDPNDYNFFAMYDNNEDRIKSVKKLIDIYPSLIDLEDKSCF